MLFYMFVGCKIHVINTYDLVWGTSFYSEMSCVFFVLQELTDVKILEIMYMICNFIIRGCMFHAVVGLDRMYYYGYLSYNA
jgi:hypothetical protein